MGPADNLFANFIFYFIVAGVFYIYGYFKGMAKVEDKWNEK
jgi:hypothetical protein